MFLNKEWVKYCWYRVIGLYIPAKRLVRWIFIVHWLMLCLGLLYGLWYLFVGYISLDNESLKAWNAFKDMVNLGFMVLFLGGWLVKWVMIASLFVHDLNAENRVKWMMWLDCLFNIFGNSVTYYLFSMGIVEEIPNLTFEDVRNKVKHHEFPWLHKGKCLLSIDKLTFFYHGTSKYDKISHYIMKKISTKWYEEHMKEANMQNDDELDAKRQQGFAVLNNINLKLSPGKFIGLIGNNGSGKSTLIKIINKLIGNYSGGVAWIGKDLKDISIRSFAKNVAYVPQQSIFYSNIKLFDFVSHGLYPNKHYWEKINHEDNALIQKRLEELEIAHLKNSLMSQLSGGEKQKAIIVRALVQRAKVIILDEPTTFLDIYTQFLILNLFKKIQKEEGITVIAILHDIKQAKLYSDEIVFLDKGTIYKSGKTERLLVQSELDYMFG